PPLPADPPDGSSTSKTSAPCRSTLLPPSLPSNTFGPQEAEASSGGGGDVRQGQWQQGARRQHRSAAATPYQAPSRPRSPCSQGSPASTSTTTCWAGPYEIQAMLLLRSAIRRRPPPASACSGGGSTSIDSAGRLLANLMVMGGTIMGRAMLQAYRKAIFKQD
ncbi:unnamed protein product, partial [Urochloa humidicola]